MPKTSKRQSGDREEWWRHDVIYQIYPRSFLDSNSDGVGDLKGICSKLDYIADLGVKTIWLSPIYKSPMKDSGYDIQDFKDIDPIFGTLEDFKTLVKEMKKKGLKLVMDLVLNHTSDQHEWFQKSLRRKEPYSDYYVWARAKAHDGDRPLAPNNWLSVFSGSAWQWSPERGQFYLHQFAREQPDLNYRNPAVLREMLAAAQFWLDLGVDGFRADAVAHLFEDEQLRDEPLSEDPGDPGEPGYGSLRHARTHNLPEAKDVLAELRRLLDLHSARTDLVRRLLMVEVYDTVPKTVEFYGNEDQPLADYPFNFVFIDEVKKESTADDVKAKIELYLKNVPQGKWPNWVMGNHDKPRVASRLGPGLVDGLNMILLLLPGTAVTYYGEELGMEDTPVSWEQTVDPPGLLAGPARYAEHSRDPARTPMQWSADKHAGFTGADRPWLPVNGNHVTVNARAQAGVDRSHLGVYRALVKARSSPAVKEGATDIRVLQGSVLCFTRSKQGSASFLVAVNWGSTSVDADLSVFRDVPREAEVYARSVDYLEDAGKTVEIRPDPSLLRQHRSSIHYAARIASAVRLIV
ncbi:maltase 1-like isoform X3 [Bacillus rossius redtenbacheri]|uniref:maltase 1-like isoform X3 n=1 Tax=Bacillus rossius redtenbacheri TaxID=93214 RepID=UPI002FDD10A9